MLPTPGIVSSIWPPGTWPDPPELHAVSRLRREHDLSRQRAGLLQGVLFLEAVGGGGFRQRQRAADEGVQLLLGQPAVDVVGAAALLLRRGVEHGEAEQ